MLVLKVWVLESDSTTLKKEKSVVSILHVLVYEDKHRHHHHISSIERIQELVLRVCYVL